MGTMEMASQILQKLTRMATESPTLMIWTMTTMELQMIEMLTTTAMEFLTSKKRTTMATGYQMIMTLMTTMMESQIGKMLTTMEMAFLTARKRTLNQTKKRNDSLTSRNTGFYPKTTFFRLAKMI